MVGYGIGLSEDRGKPTVVINQERQFTTVSLANTQSGVFKLHGNSDGQSANAEGGGYFGDSGSTAFWEPHPYAFGTLSGGVSASGSTRAPTPSTPESPSASS